MATLDPYAACPCGSGNKFKWCCQPIYDDIINAFRLEKEGQHEAAARAIDEVVAKHPNNPEAWGRKAQLLYQQQRPEEADKALQTAFEKNARYPFGHYLQGRILHSEGEIAGSLTMFRRAVECYDPASRPVLAEIQSLIFDCELKLNHPVAARAALELALRYDPAHDELRKAFEQVFGDQSHLPPSARREYTYLTLAADAPPERRAAWQKTVAPSSKLADAVIVFRQLTEQDPADAAAWFNLGLSLAWLGNNLAAIDALEKYVALETDDDKAAQAWALAEVLTCGQGAEDRGDLVENLVMMVIRQPDQAARFVEKLHGEQRLIGAQLSEEDQVLTALVLEKPALSVALTPNRRPRLGAALMLMGNLLTLRNTFKPALEQVVEEFRQGLGGNIGEQREIRSPARFSDLFSEAMIFPLGVTDQAEAQTVISESFERYFEQIWLGKPLKSLNGTPPIDAAGHPVLRRKLLGIVQFLQECAAINQFPYDFDRLRRKLHLLGAAPAAPGSAPADIGALGVAELAQLPIETLAGEQLEQAYQTALHLDAKELAGKFAKALVSAAPRQDRPDRFVWFNHLVQLAQAAGDLDGALQHVDEGEKDDCENNEGRRRNDFELRRGQLQVKQGQFDQAAETFGRLIARVPSELRFQGTAAESMLSARQGPRALTFAEQGLAAARQQNNRDMENYFSELVAAAKK